MLASVACGDDTPTTQKPSPAFSISVDAGQSPQAGGPATSVRLSIAPENEFAGNVSVSLLEAPPGTAFTPEFPLTIGAGATRTVAMSIAGSTQPGTYPLRFRGTGDAVTREAATSITVTAARAFSLNTTATSLRPGRSASVDVAVTAIGGFADSVSVSLDSLPAGVSVVGSNAAVVVGSGTARFVVQASASAASGHAVLVARGVAKNVQRSATVGLDLVPPTWLFKTGNTLVLDRVEGSDSVRVVIDLKRGGMLSEASINGLQTLSAADPGRGVQVWLFDGAQGYDDCRGCSFQSTYNPVQGGDRSGHENAATAGDVSGAELYSKATGMMWNPRGGVTGSDMIIEQWVSAVLNEPRAVKLRYRITHTGGDEHLPASQWVPVVNARPTLNRLVRYDDNAPWTNGAPTASTPAPGQSAVIAMREQWAAWVGDDNRGVAVWTPSTYQFTKARVDGVANYVAGSPRFGLAGPSTIAGEAYLILGDVAAARATVYRLHGSTTRADISSPFGFIDVPRVDSIVTGSIGMRGWAVDDAGVATVEVRIDGTKIGTASYGNSPRPDLQPAFPGVAINAGWALTYDSRSLPDGPHEVSIRMIDSSGNAATTSRTFYANNGGMGAPPVVTVTTGAPEVVIPASAMCGTSDIIDMPARAARVPTGGVVLSAPNGPTNYLSYGPDLDHVTHSCQAVLTSPQNTKPDNHDAWYWIGALYRSHDTVHALVHVEFHDPISAACGAGNASPGNPCDYTSIVYAFSTDGARTFRTPTPPKHLVASYPERWEPSPGAFYGYRMPSNIIHAKDDYYYFLIHVVLRWDVGGGYCLARTRALDDPSSWRAWDGASFSIAMASPYVVGDDAVPVCAIVARVGGEISSLTFNTYLDRYMWVGAQGPPSCGYVYSLSKDLIHWTVPALLVKQPLAYVGNGCEATPGQKVGSTLYGSLLDPSDTSLNFEQVGQHGYVYFSRWLSNNESNRELVRVPVAFTKR